MQFIIKWQYFNFTISQYNFFAQYKVHSCYCVISIDWFGTDSPKTNVTYHLVKSPTMVNICCSSLVPHNVPEKFSFFLATLWTWTLPLYIIIDHSFLTHTPSPQCLLKLFTNDQLINLHYHNIHQFNVPAFSKHFMLTCCEIISMFPHSAAMTRIILQW